MTGSELDVEALMAALDAQRSSKGLSWRALAREVEVSPSSLTRMQQGKHPDVNTFSALVRWLGLPAETFLATEKSRSKRDATEPNIAAIASTLLRGKREMSPQAAKALDELVKAAIEFAKRLE